ncbi:MAG: NADH-quinone oxidoreductase subunit J [Vicinamibacterales bacterium]
MPESILFYVFGALAVLASALVIGQSNPMYSVLLLVLSFGAISGLYVLLDAPFLAVIQVIVYAGAIMVLFLYVVMLLNAPHEDAAEFDRQHPLRQPGAARLGAVLAALLVAELAWAVSRTVEAREAVGAGVEGSVVSSVRTIGRVMFTEYTFAFEATSLLILVALVGGLLLARRESRP